MTTTIDRAEVFSHAAARFDGDGNPVPGTGRLRRYGPGQRDPDGVQTSLRPSSGLRRGVTDL